MVTQILHYFQRNPEAMDTLEGIARWRLLEEHIHTRVQETQQAVEWLVRKGFLLEEARASAGKLYRLNPERANDISSFLRNGNLNDTGGTEQDR